MKLIKIVTLFALILCFFSTDKAMEGPGQHQDETESRPTKRRRTEPISHDSALIEALRAGDIQTFNEITTVDGFENVTNQTLEELLIIARQGEHQEIVSDIELEQKNRSNKDYSDRLRAAIEHDDLAELQKIIDHKGINYNYAHIFGTYEDQNGELQDTTDESITAMSIATESDQPKAILIRWLIDHGADVNEGALKYALERRDYDLAEYALNRGADTFTFHGDPSELQFLFANGSFSHLFALNGALQVLMAKPDDTSFLKYARWLLLHGFYVPTRLGTSESVFLPDDILRLDWAHTLTPQRRMFDLHDVVSAFVKYFFKDSPISAAFILLRGDNQVPEIRRSIGQALFLQKTIQKLLAGGDTSLKTILQQTETIVLESISQALDDAQIKSHLETSNILDEDLVLQIKTSLERAIRLQTDIHELIKRAAPDDESLKAITDILTNVEKLTLHRISTVLGETGIDDQFTTLSIDRLEERQASEIQDSLDALLSRVTRDFNESLVQQLTAQRQAIITDLNNALIVTAGRNIRAPVFLEQADLLTPETYSEALLAAGLNKRLDMFRLLIDHSKLSADHLKPVLQKLLRPVIISGNSEFFQTLLQIALRNRIILDVLPKEEEEDELPEEKKVTPIAELIDILLASPTISTSAEKRTQYQQIRYHLMEHIRRRAYVRRLEETPNRAARDDNLIPREHLPLDLQRPKSRFAPVEYYQLPQVQGFMPLLPADIMRYIISLVLANYLLRRPGGK